MGRVRYRSPFLAEALFARSGWPATQPAMHACASESEACVVQLKLGAAPASSSRLQLHLCRAVGPAREAQVLYSLWLCSMGCACYGCTYYGYGMLAMAILVMAILTTSSERAPIAWAAGAETQTLLLYPLWLFLERLYLLRLELRAGAKKSSVRSQVLYLYLLWLYLLWYCYGCESTYDVQCKLTTASPPHHHRTSPERYKST